MDWRYTFGANPAYNSRKDVGIKIIQHIVRSMDAGLSNKSPSLACILLRTPKLKSTHMSRVTSELVMVQWLSTNLWWRCSLWPKHWSPIHRKRGPCRRLNNNTAVIYLIWLIFDLAIHKEVLPGCLHFIKLRPSKTKVRMPHKQTYYLGCERTARFVQHVEANTDMNMPLTARPRDLAKWRLRVWVQCTELIARAPHKIIVQRV